MQISGRARAGRNGTDGGTGAPDVGSGVCLARPSCRLFGWRRRCLDQLQRLNNQHLVRIRKAWFFSFFFSETLHDLVW